MRYPTLLLAAFLLAIPAIPANAHSVCSGDYLDAPADVHSGTLPPAGSRSFWVHGVPPNAGVAALTPEGGATLYAFHANVDACLILGGSVCFSPVCPLAPEEGWPDYQVEIRCNFRFTSCPYTLAVVFASGLEVEQ